MRKLKAAFWAYTIIVLLLASTSTIIKPEKSPNEVKKMCASFLNIYGTLSNIQKIA